MCSNYSLQEQWKNRSKWKESTEMKIYLQIWVLIYVVVQLIIMVLFARLNLGFGYMIIGFGIWYVIMIILIVLAPIILSALPTDRSHSQPMPSLRSQEIEMNSSVKRNFRSKENKSGVILSCTDLGASSKFWKETKTSDMEDSDCVICFEPLTSRGRFIFPCGHATFCFDCGQKIAKQDESRCPLCRTEIRQVNNGTVISMNF